MISIPTIVLRKASFDLGRKLVIGVVLCMSLLMISIALVRGVSAGVLGTEAHEWNSFWVQLEATISVFAACPTAFRSLFLVNGPSNNGPDRRSSPARLWNRTRPSLKSIHIGATLKGIRTMIRGSRGSTLELYDDGVFALGPASDHNLHSVPPVRSREPSLGRTYEPAQARTVV